MRKVVDRLNWRTRLGNLLTFFRRASGSSSQQRGRRDPVVRVTSKPGVVRLPRSSGHRERQRLPRTDTFEWRTALRKLRIPHTSAWKWGTLVALILVVFGFGWGFFRWFRVDSIVCTSTQGVCAREIEMRLDGFKETFIPWSMWVAPNQIAREFGQVKGISIETNWDRELIVDLETDTPAVLVTTSRLEELQRYFTVSFEGVLMNETAVRREPVLYVSNLQDLVGMQLTREQVKAVHVVYHMTNLGYLGVAYERNDYLSFVLKDTQIGILFPLDGWRPAEDMVSSLHLILSQTKMSDNPVQIDLRFAKPVIRDLTYKSPVEEVATVSGELEE